MARSFSGPFALLILDGYAHNPNPKGNAVAAARKPSLDQLFKSNPWTELATFGERVGLPDDQMGNSEVGHLNIGAGRVVEQELTRINRLVRTKTLGENKQLASAFALVKEGPLQQSAERALHVLGLTSSGGVHSSLAHIQALVEAAASSGVKRIYVHVTTDGRDKPPTASLEEIPPLVDFLKQVSERYGIIARIPSVCGRYYAMDRDKRWERTERAYDLYTNAAGTEFPSVIQALEGRIASGQTDEFLEPSWIPDARDTRRGTMEDGDVLLFANFRADRMRQIVRTFLDETVPFNGFPRKKRPQIARIFTLTEYEEGLPVEILFPPFFVEQHFGWAIAQSGLRQLRLAETEKYAHVTYFFSGGNEEPMIGEERVMVPSPKDVPTYDKKPEMSAQGVTDELIKRLQAGNTDVAIVNFANCDMVGHTGVFDAAVKAVETVDTCVGKILAQIEKLGGAAIITADHGNADQMVDYDTGEPHTFHTKYPVPFALFGKPFRGLQLGSGGALCEIAPTALEMLNLPQPQLMTGRSLISTK